MRRFQRPHTLPFLLAAAGLVLYILIHPNNTCADWFEKWGQLHGERWWSKIHQIGSLAFAAAAVGALRLPSLRLNFGRELLVAGFAVYCMVLPIHSSSVSFLGQAAHKDGVDLPTRSVLRTTGEAFVVYDEYMTGISLLLVAGGGVLLCLFGLARGGGVWGGRPLRLVLAFISILPSAQYWSVPVLRSLLRGEDGRLWTFVVWFILLALVEPRRETDEGAAG